MSYSIQPSNTQKQLLLNNLIEFYNNKENMNNKILIYKALHYVSFLKKQVRVKLPLSLATYQTYIFQLVNLQ